MIEKYLYAANDFIAAHPTYGLVFAFLVAFAESLPILGTLIPGSLTMTLIGVLVGRNLLPLGFTLLLGFIGAILGDIIGFAIGIRYQGRLHTVWPFKKYPKWLKLILLGESFFQKHGGKSVIIGRFIGPTRSSVPLIAGLLRMRWRSFIAAAIPSAFLWALLYLLPGVLIGAISLSLPKEKAATFTLIGFGIIVLLWLLFWALQRFFSYLCARINAGVDYLWQRLRFRSPILKHWLTTQTNPKDHHQLTMAIFALVFFSLFAMLYFFVQKHTGPYTLNEPVFYFLQSIRNAHTDKFFVVITELGETPLILVITALCACALAYQKKWRTLWHLVGLMFVTCAILWVLKHTYYNPRPTGFMRIDKSSSFPSGHVTLSVTLFGFLTYLNARSLKKYWFWLTYTISALLIASMAVSRLYLGAHWLCDVLAGLCLGLGLLLIALISFRRGETSPKKPRFLLLCTIIAILLPWAVASVKNFHRDFYHYTTYYPHQTVALNNWWHFPAAYVPIYRVNRLGKPIQPLNVQWAGQLAQIREHLQQAGWIEIDIHHNLQTTLQRFATKNPENNLAFLPVLYRQKPPALFMIKHPENKKGIYELRLWDSGVDFENSPLVLYVGSIDYHKPGQSYISLKPSLLITLRQGGGIYGLSSDVAEYYQSKKVLVTTLALPKKISILEWDRHILMLKPDIQ